jgi:hypothetical protein
MQEGRRALAQAQIRFGMGDGLQHEPSLQQNPAPLKRSRPGSAPLRRSVGLGLRLRAARRLLGASG